MKPLFLVAALAVTAPVVAQGPAPEVYRVLQLRAAPGALAEILAGFQARRAERTAAGETLLLMRHSQPTWRRPPAQRDSRVAEPLDSNYGSS